jgi:iron complex outermembrane recepter protein
MRNSKFQLTVSTIVLAFAFAHAAFAQSTASSVSNETASESAGGQLEVVVVTAQKRTENLQDTPIAVSVLTAQGLEDRGVKSLADLGNGAIPSLKVAPFFSRPGALIMNIRGIGVLADSNQPARDQGVGVYVDGVYLGRPQGLGTALYDIASIEVLKGPQGTLFGRNTSGGAVNIVTKKPSGDLKLSGSVGVSSFDGRKGEVHLDLPSFANISTKIDAVVTSRAGWVDNPLPNAEDYGSFDRRGYRIAALWEPTANFNAEYAYDNGYDATSTLFMQLLEVGTFRQAARAPAQPNRIRESHTGLPQQLSIGETQGHRLGMDWNITENLRLKYIGSSRELIQSQWDNANFAQSMSTASGVFTNVGLGRYSLSFFTQDQMSHEVQLIGETQRLKYVAGAIYYEENVGETAGAFNTAVFTDAIGQNYSILALDYNQRIDRATQVKTTSTGVFGQSTYTPPIFNDRLHLTLGGRWTNDKKVGALTIVNGALPVVNGISAARTLDTSWDRFDPLINVAFDLNDDIMIYAKRSSGYKSGGANSRSLFYAAFNPESVVMNEIGVKAEFWNRRARLNVAAYNGIYEDIQLDFFAQYLQFDPVTGQTLSTLRTTSETINAPGEGDISGFEAELTVVPTDRLMISASYAHNIVKIPATLNPFRQANGQLITVPIPIYQVYTPENSGSISVNYDAPFMGMTFNAYLDANFDDGFFANSTDVAYDPVTRAVTVPQPKGDESFNVNARLSLTDIPMGTANGTISLWSRNLLNEEHVFYRVKGVAQGTSGFFNELRTVGLELRLKL